MAGVSCQPLKFVLRMPRAAMPACAESEPITEEPRRQLVGALGADRLGFDSAPVDEVGGDLVEEARGRVGHRLPPRRAHQRPDRYSRSRALVMPT